MPKISSLNMIAPLAECGIDIPAFLITGVHDAAIERRAASLGIMTVVEKRVPHREPLLFISLSVG